MLHYSNSLHHFGVDWQIKRNPVYRLLDNEKWADNFFNDGELMLSSFKKFKSYPNEIQGDLREGNGFVSAEDEEGNTKIVVYESGLNGYVLSTTKMVNDKIKGAFNAKSIIKINNPTMFALEIAKKLPFVEAGIEGDCDYEDTRVITLKKSEARNVFNNLDFKNDLLRSKAIFTSLTMGVELFLKLNTYSYQNEYRLLWFSNAPISDTIVIKCPEAIRYCERVDI